MYGRRRTSITSYTKTNENEYDEISNGEAPLVMLVIHNLDHMMQPHEWETLLTREIHGARIYGVSVVREQSLSRPWGEGELIAYIFTRHDTSVIQQYLHNRRLGFRRLHVDTVTSKNGIEQFIKHKIHQLLKFNPQMTEANIEQRISSFYQRIPSVIRPQEYDRTAILRLIHECMGLPVSPPTTNENCEIDSDSPTAVPSKVNVQRFRKQNPLQTKQKNMNPPLIRIDENTMQLHFTPFYFELMGSMIK